LVFDLFNLRPNFNPPPFYPVRTFGFCLLLLAPSTPVFFLDGSFCCGTPFVLELFWSDHTPLLSGPHKRSLSFFCFFFLFFRVSFGTRVSFFFPPPWLLQELVGGRSSCCLFFFNFVFFFCVSSQILVTQTPLVGFFPPGFFLFPLFLSTPPPRVVLVWVLCFVSIFLFVVFFFSGPAFPSSGWYPFFFHHHTLGVCTKNHSFPFFFSFSPWFFDHQLPLCANFLLFPGIARAQSALFSAFNGCRGKSFSVHTTGQILLFWSLCCFQTFPQSPPVPFPALKMVLFPTF